MVGKHHLQHFATLLSAFVAISAVEKIIAVPACAESCDSGIHHAQRLNQLVAETSARVRRQFDDSRVSINTDLRSGEQTAGLALPTPQTKRDANETFQTEAIAVDFIIPLLPRATGVTYFGAAVTSLQRFASASMRHLYVFADQNQMNVVENVFHDGGKPKSLPWSLLQRPPRPHPRLSQGLAAKFGDSPERVRWRTQLVLDFVDSCRSVLEAGSNSTDRSRFALMWFEDDIVVNDVKFAPRLQRLMVDAPPTWFVIGLLGYNIDPDKRSWLWDNKGWGGKGTMVFNANHLPGFLDYATANCDQAPLDWLIEFYVRRHRQDLHMLRLDPPGLKHLGQHSSWGDPSWSKSNS